MVKKKKKVKRMKSMQPFKTRLKEERIIESRKKIEN